MMGEKQLKTDVKSGKTRHCQLKPLNNLSMGIKQICHLLLD